MRVRLRERGQGLAEYAILLAFIVVFCMVAVVTFSSRVSAFMSNINLGG